MEQYQKLADEAIESSKDFFDSDEMTHVLIDGAHIPIRDAIAILFEQQAELDRCL